MVISTNLEDFDDFGGGFTIHVEEEEEQPSTTEIILQLREKFQKSEEECSLYKQKAENLQEKLNKWEKTLKNELSADPDVVLKEIHRLRKSEELLSQKLDKAMKKEASFLATFGNKEREIHDLKTTVCELKAQLKPESMKTTRLLLDPAIHDKFVLLKSALEEKDKKIKELQENLEAVNFTPNSKMGNLLVAKCRILQEENAEISRQVDEGKVGDLEARLKMQKDCNIKLREETHELVEYAEELENGFENSHEMVNCLKRKLEEKDREIEGLRSKKVRIDEKNGDGMQVGLGDIGIQQGET